MEKYFPLTPETPFVAELTARLETWPVFDQEPQPEQVCDLINTMFWASMQLEEGRLVRASVVLTDTFLRNAFRLSNPIELTLHNIAKLSSSFPFHQGAIAIRFPPQGHPLIWGFALSRPMGEWLIETIGLGYIVFRHGPSIEAALLPDGKRLLFRQGTRLEDEWCHLLFGLNIFYKQIPFELQFQVYDFLRVLSRTMVEHRRGGTLVVVNPTDQTWRHHTDFAYEFSKPEEYLSILISKLRKWQDGWYRRQIRKQKMKGEEHSEILISPDSKKEQELRQALRLAGGLTVVDGAMVIMTDLKILGYGAKLKAPVKQLKIREWFPYSDYPSESITLERIGGTRHQSAARFVFHHPESVVFVASQGGRFTILYCDEAGDEVVAYRAELLLL